MSFSGDYSCEWPASYTMLYPTAKEKRSDADTVHEKVAVFVGALQTHPPL
jgi:hypothetical protein